MRANGVGEWTAESPQLEAAVRPVNDIHYAPQLGENRRGCLGAIAHGTAG
jgi:tetrahydromethanopterin S-methyltransferase subunit F